MSSSKARGPSLIMIFADVCREQCRTLCSSGMGHATWYMTVRLSQNIVQWSTPFLDQFARSGTRDPLAGLTLGFPASDDPNELVVEADDNWLDQPRDRRAVPALMIYAAIYNSQPIVNRAFGLRSTVSGGRRDAKGSPNSPVR